MKKMVFSLALFLGGAGSVLAQVNADKVIVRREQEETGRS